eukprot:scaffold106145_cov22-Prasinocladus_malaysianus.AAC.1
MKTTDLKCGDECSECLEVIISKGNSVPDHGFDQSGWLVAAGDKDGGWAGGGRVQRRGVCSHQFEGGGAAGGAVQAAGHRGRAAEAGAAAEAAGGDACE